jgi:type IV pilus assembly protein PilE
MRMSPNCRTRAARGFTMIELMMTVAVIAILAAIALPNYTEYIQRSKIIEATNKLAEHRVRMEQYFQDNRTYASAGTTCGVADPAYAAGKDAFKVACTGASATTYTVTATGQGTMNGFVFTIDQSNARKTTGVPTKWSKNDTCWVVRKSGACS